MRVVRVRSRGHPQITKVANHGWRVLSVKGKKVLHIDRNDHYGGFVRPLCPSGTSTDSA